MHALAWAQPSGLGGNGIDNQYLAYQQQPLTLIDSSDPRAGSQQVTLDFSLNTIPTSPFSADVHSTWAGAQTFVRSLHGVVVFDSNGYIEVVTVRDAFQTSSITATMPVLPGSHVVFIAFQRSFGHFGAVHHEIVPPDTSVSLDIPEPVALLAPPHGALGIDIGTTFTWSPRPSVSTLAVDCDFVGFRVITGESMAQVPDLPSLGRSLPKGATCSWHVDVHGSHATVDDASNPKGMIDPCLYDDNCENGSLRDDGSITVSDVSQFATAP